MISKRCTTTQNNYHQTSDPEPDLWNSEWHRHVNITSSFLLQPTHTTTQWHGCSRTSLIILVPHISVMQCTISSIFTSMFGVLTLPSLSLCCSTPKDKDIPPPTPCCCLRTNLSASRSSWEVPLCTWRTTWRAHCLLDRSVGGAASCPFGSALEWSCEEDSEWGCQGRWGRAKRETRCRCSGPALQSRTAPPGGQNKHYNFFSINSDLYFCESTVNVYPYLDIRWETSSKADQDFVSCN